MYKEKNLKKGKKEEYENAVVSAYVPDHETREITAHVLKDYIHGINLQNKSRAEFNNRSLLQEIDVNQKRFNSYVPPKSNDPDEDWRAQTVRPLTRNKLISIAAHVTQAILFPNVFAQNDSQQEDKEVSLVMRDLIEYEIQNSNYQRSFLQVVITMLVDPAALLESRFSEVVRTVRKKQKDGTYELKEIIDDVLSGFSANVVPCKEILISNIFEPNIQKQRFVIRNRYIDYSEAEQIYGKHANFKYVHQGVRTVFDPGTNTFYDVVDEEAKDYLVNEVVYYNRTKDLCLYFINGVLVSDPENPNPREDKKYPWAKGGYEPLNNGQFFYYKSAAAKLASDQDIVDVLYNMVLDGTYLQLMPPLALYGSEEIDSSVIVPGQTTSFADPDTKLESIGPRIDTRAGLEAMSLVERSMAESSQDSLLAGVFKGGERTARESILLQQNAKVALGLFGKMVAFLVEDFGHLMISDILQYETVATLDETTNALRYKSFMVPAKNENGKTVTKKIQFSSELEPPEDGETPEQQSQRLMDKSYEILQREGGIKSDVRISVVNPLLIRQYKYKLSVNADELTPKAHALEKAMLLEGYDRAIQNPTVDQAMITKDFLLEALKPGESDKYMKKADVTPAVQGMMGGADQAGGLNRTVNQKGVNTSLLSQITGSNNLGIAAGNES